MRKKILSIYLAVAIGFLSVVVSAVPVYASNSTNWEDYFSIKYNATATDAPYTLKFKSTTAQDDYDKLSKDERKKVDYDAFSAISAKDQQHKYDGLVLSKTSLPDFIGSIAKAAGVAIPGGISGGGGITADLQDKLTKVSNSIASSNRKFGGAGISFKASSKNPTNFGLGKITLTKDFINDVRANVAKFDDYVIFPSANSDSSYYLDFIGASDIHEDFTSFFNRTVASDGFVFMYHDKSGTAYASFAENINYKNCYFYKDDSGSLCYYDFNKGTSDDIFRKTYKYDFYKYTSGNMACYYNDYNIVRFDYKDFVGRMNLYTKVFDSYNALLKYMGYLSGENDANYFIANTTVNNDYSTTVNKIYNYADYGYTDTIQGQIDKAITDKGSGLTDEEYQKIVDDVMHKVQQEIDAKEDTDDSGSSGGGGTGGGSSGGDSGGSGTDSGESDKWLEKIFNRLGDILEKIGTVTGIETITEYIKQIADDVATLKEGGTLSADMSNTNGLLKDIKGLLGTLIAVQAVGDVADLLADTVGDKISDYADNVKSAVTEVTDTLQDVFPFSIPWDLMAIFALFAAEPVAPEFDIPIKVDSLGIEHTIHIDFTNFEQISTMSRAFLSVIFACGLMYLTIRLTNGGNDDD